MRALILAMILIAVAASAHAETDFAGMLAAAERGDSMARVVVGYSFYLGKYRDGTPVERDFDKAYAWASLANYQGNPEAQRLLDLVIPRLADREKANALAGEYLERYGAERREAASVPSTEVPKAEEKPAPTPKEQTPKEQLEVLMNEGIPLAEKMLREQGEFFPFGMVQKADGSVQQIGASDGREHPPPKDVAELLGRAFRRGAESGDYAATAIFMDVRTTPPGGSAKVDAVQVGLEHRSGYCVDVFFPYQRSADGTVKWGDLFASKREGSAFSCK